MAIISCPECGRQVSDKALKCPQCAHPIANITSQKSEHQNDIVQTGKLISNKEDKTKFIVNLILVLSMCGFGAAIIITFQMAGYNPFKSNFKSDSPKMDISEILPPHTVTTTTFKSIGLTGEGGRVRVESLDPQLSRDDCIKLATKYKPTDGQVSVHKPSLKFKIEVLPFCVDNLDGQGVIFNDGLF